jgi:hypothetical protein
LQLALSLRLVLGIARGDAKLARDDGIERLHSAGDAAQVCAADGLGLDELDGGAGLADDLHTRAIVWATTALHRTDVRSARLLLVGRPGPTPLPSQARAHRLSADTAVRGAAPTGFGAGTGVRLRGLVAPDLDLERRDLQRVRGNLAVEDEQPMPGALSPSSEAQARRRPRSSVYFLKRLSRSTPPALSIKSTASPFGEWCSDSCSGEEPVRSRFRRLRSRHRPTQPGLDVVGSVMRASFNREVRPLPDPSYSNGPSASNPLPGVVYGATATSSGGICSASGETSR